MDAANGFQALMQRPHHGKRQGRAKPSLSGVSTACLLLLTTLTLLSVRPTFAQCLAAKLTASDGFPEDGFSRAVSIDGGFAIVGTGSDANPAGGAFVYRRQGNDWNEVAILTDGTETEHTGFGASVSIHGDLAVVGAPNDDGHGASAGAAYVFRAEGDAWVRKARLSASDPRPQAHFGVSVSIDNDLIVVGADAEGAEEELAGAAYVFGYNGETWLEVAKLTPSAGHAGDGFGQAVSLDSSTAVVGAPYADCAAGAACGAAYVFRASATDWTEDAKVSSPEASATDYFGASVSVRADLLAVGAPQSSEARGSVHAYRRLGTSWVHEAHLVSPSPHLGDRFGSSVAALETRIVIGVKQEHDPNYLHGGVHIFEEHAGGWDLKVALRAPDPDLRYGQCVSASEQFALVGTSGLDDPGAAYVLSVVDTVFVDQNASGANDGTTWSNAYTYLQDGLHTAYGCSAVRQVRVAQGVYKPDQGANQTLGDRDATFLLPVKIAVLGGYAGVLHADPDERDRYKYVSVLSGDLMGNDIGSFDDPSREDNSYHVASALTINVKDDSILDGFTIVRGHAADSHGAGLNLRGSDPTVRNCTFSFNYAGRGGALRGQSNDGIVSNCIFSFNGAEFFGGAIEQYDCSDTRFSDCMFVANWSGRSGGAISVQSHSYIVVERSRFINNTSIDGGAIGGAPASKLSECVFMRNSAQRGGAICGSGSQVVNCTFANNHADEGGAAYGVGGSLIRCRFLGNTATANGGAMFSGFDAHPTITECLFSGNSAANGGALYVHRGSTPSFVNCTLASNSAQANGGGAYLVNNGNPLFYNTVLWGNLDGAGSGESAQIYDDISLDANYPQFRHCRVEGWTGIFGGVANSGGDPLFVDPHGPDAVAGTNDDNLRVQLGSSCIDAGDNDVVPTDLADVDADLDVYELLPLDIELSARFFDEPSVPDTGNGEAPIVDIGAYEWLDCNENGVADAQDISDTTSVDRDGNGIPDECEPDCNENGITDAADLHEGTSYDCNGNGLPDECDIDRGTPAGGGPFYCVSDCDPDCNVNGVPDACDIAECGQGVLACRDCNFNGTPDACDLTDATSVDCNIDGIPDDCEVGGLVTATSPVYSPVGYGITHVYTLHGLRQSVGQVFLEATGYGGLYIGQVYVDLDGIHVGTLFDSGARDCSEVPDTDQIAVSADLFNEFASDGRVEIALTGSSRTDPYACESMSWMTVTVGYERVALFDDCNTNGVPDECDLADGLSIDCDGNDVPDECEPDCNDNDVTDACDLADSTSEDCNENTVPDECDIVDGTSYDCNENAVPDECDIAAQASEDCSSNGIPDECEPDCNENSSADSCDIQNETSSDCDWNGIPDECDVVLFVDKRVTGNNDGSRWDDAFVDLQAALLRAADPDSGVTQIWVSQGMYTPTPPGGDRSVSFTLVDGVTVFGGFDGGEATCQQRKPAMYKTILSGDLNGDDEPSGVNREDNSFNVVYFGERDGRSSVDGVTITAGNANGNDFAELRGAGAFVEEGYASFRNCIFHDSAALMHGGGLYNIYGESTLTNCLFIGNSAGQCGGGVFTAFNDVLLHNCTIYGNEGDCGGGVFASASGAHLRGCVLWANIEQGRTDEQAQIGETSGEVFLDFSCVQGWTGELGGVGNTGSDPLFIDPTGLDGIAGTFDDDLRLLPESPLINAGDPGFALEPGATDIDGDLRLQGCRVDMGAYESDVTQTPGDFDGNESLDLSDLAGFQLCINPSVSNPAWLDACLCIFDYNDDDQIDLSDFTAFYGGFVNP